ncbi:alpha/beta fold hydrolase [Salinibius halmophilus]|uniref:alpha/beta fold hydrolase n=1 Tax=Salinibius halmophilus TaxID=1853216 RepID=UPI001314FF13|nr:alpha/beta hydrolase [Salinibius halmophilus]
MVAILVIAAAIVCVFLVLVLLEKHLNKKFRTQPTGEMLGKWHVDKQIVNSGPTVVFESGLDSSGLLGWSPVIKALNGQVNTLRYDRLGYGFSHAAQSSRTINQLSIELEEMLRTANPPKPFILVGHSLGGLVVQSLASRAPDLAAAVVLIDASHPEQTKTFPDNKLDISKVPPRWILKLMLSTGLLRRITLKQFQAYSLNTREIAHYLTMGGMNIHRELSALAESLEQASQITSLGTIPLRVIVGSDAKKRAMPRSKLAGEAIRDWWLALQTDYLNLSSDSKLVEAKHSGHLVILDEPEVCANVIKALAESKDSEAQL